ncbi:hypothetical protein [Streptomyces olivoreticuli]|uniref:hypothetical protein n=1 Tax=Streptomyces olivoreticuli TaxID=68246 RepID=UPI000E2710D1|nr:hypothetical protein [Streptomyces olivoreticuli]
MDVMSPKLLGMLDRLHLTPNSLAVLGMMTHLQEFGGAVHLNQAELAEKLGLHESAVSRGMQLLTSRNLVLPRGRGRGHRLHPLIAKYESEEAMRGAFLRAQSDITAGALPDIKAPLYAKKPPRSRAGGPHLVSVAS